MDEETPVREGGGEGREGGEEEGRGRRERKEEGGGKGKEGGRGRREGGGGGGGERGGREGGKEEGRGRRRGEGRGRREGGKEGGRGGEGMGHDEGRKEGGSGRGEGGKKKGGRGVEGRKERVREGLGVVSSECLSSITCRMCSQLVLGNLPPGASVLIKITYVSELVVEGDHVLFSLPGSVAPWKQEAALDENIQTDVEKSQGQRAKVGKWVVRFKISVAALDFFFFFFQQKLLSPRLRGDAI